MRSRTQLLTVLSVVFMMVVAAGMIGVVAGNGPVVEGTTAQTGAEGDITVSTFEGPAVGEPGEEVTTAVEIVNEGDETTDVEIGLHTDWGHLSEDVTLEPGERVEYEVTGELPSTPGEYIQWLEVNDNAWASWTEVTESPEDQPALRITAVDIPTSAAAEETETVGVTVENLGNAPGTAELHFDGTTADDHWTVELDPGESQEFTADVEIAHELEHDFFFNLQQPEMDEPAAIIDYTAAVDLPALDDVSIEPETLPDLHVHGEHGVVEATIHNDGDEDLVLPVRYVFDDNVVDGTDLRVMPGEARTVSLDMPPELPIGTWEHGIQIGSLEVTDDLIVVDEELAGMIESYEDEIADLEAELDAKEDEIADLEAELADADVSIDVSVEPEDAATFQVGGAALVSIESDDVEPSAVTIEADGEEYAADGGETSVPLTDAGELDLSVNYGDATESVSIAVQEADTDDDTADDDDDGMPGFGPIAALIAILGSLGFLRHRTTST